jgi:Ca-activated chloride channel family protein
VSPLASVLTGVRGERIALSDVTVSATLRDLLGEVTVRQTYRNDEDVNIEAVYTFPLPLDAVLLDLRVEIGARTLTGVVVEKKAAEKTYEAAIAAGDAAVMLEAIEPGLYTMNVGNLLPGETAAITFVYAIVYRWAGDTLRVLLPTTIAPRYGASPHAPHQVPESSLVVENQFSVQVDVFGSLRQAQFECPSHAVTLASSPEKAVITLEQAHAVMDRDFILTVRAPHAAHSFAISGADGEGAAAIASFKPLFPGLRQPRALELAIVIDCSGSMQGDSIAQARQALAGILDALQPRDRMTIVAFGNTTKLLSDRLLPCTPTNLQEARQFAAALAADMGGTEIGPALKAAYAAASGSESGDVFLVTDGEVSSWQAVVEEAKRSGRRVFTVGVGSAVSEAFVRGLAAATGGGCELVSPREGMADRVIRHFERMRAPRAKRIAVHWPEGARDVAPAAFGAVFEGDTVTASAQFDRPQFSGHVTLEIETDGGDAFRHELLLMPPPEPMDRTSTVARLAASARLKEADPVAGLKQALHYRLVSPWTNWLVVAARPDGERALEIPALRKVPQTMAAGWSGVGAVASLADTESLATLRATLPPPGAAAGGFGRHSMERLRKMASDVSSLRRQADRLNRRVETLAAQAERAVKSLQPHAEEVGHELRAVENQIEELLREIETLRSRVNALDDQLLRRLPDGRQFLVQLEELLEHLQERCRLLRRLHEVAREWTEIAARYRHLAKT